MGATLRLTQGPLWNRTLLNIFLVIELFDVDKMRGLESLFRALGPKSGPLGSRSAHWLHPLVILIHGGYFEALSGAPKDSNFG